MMTKLIQPEEIKLSNGIPVILQHDDSSVAATYWWVKVGSADEAPEEAGFAHFLEHMLFKDAAAKETGRASTGQMARTIESLGGDINAYTSFDQTVYHVTCAAHHWERVLNAFGTIAQPQEFLKQDFEREREVILEELRKNEDSPGRQLFQSLFSLTYAKHPYGKPVIGFEKTLKAATPRLLERFYRHHYVAGNMGIILVGPIYDEKGGGKKKQALIKQLETYFGSKALRPAAPSARSSRALEVSQKKASHWKVKSFDVKTPSFSISFRVPELGHEDLPAIDLLSSVLGMGELSRLYQRLFYQTSLVTDVSTGLYVPKDPGMLYFHLDLDSIDKVSEVARELFAELKKIAEEGPTLEELKRVLINAESERLYATQTADGMAGRIGFLRFIAGDLNYDQQYLDALKAVSPAQIAEVARKYLNYGRMSGVLLVPEEHKGFEVTSLRELAEKTLDFEISSGKERAVKHRSRRPAGMPEVIRTSSGLRICFNPRPRSHVFSIHASVFGGVRLETAHPIENRDADWGSSHLMALTWNKGTSKKNAREIAAVVEGHAAGMDGFSGRSSVGLQMTGLSRDWGILSETFTECLLDPTFPEEEIEHSRRVVEDSIRSIEDHSSQLCSKLFLDALFEHHPYGRIIYGSLDSIRTIGSSKLRAYHRNWVRPDRLVLSLSGAVSESALEGWVAGIEKQLHELGRNQLGGDVDAALTDEPNLKAPRWVEKSLGREQSHILVGGLGIQLNSADRLPLQLLQTLLGGQSGRLFIELREKKSLAYSVAPLSFEGIERGYVGTYIACAPDKKEEAIAGIRTVLQTLVDKGPSEKEIKRAKEFFLGRRAMDLQSDSALASHYGLETLYGIPHLGDAELMKKVDRITAKEIRAVCKKYLIDPYQVTSVVG